MQEKYKLIKEKYDSFQNHLLKNGRLLLKDTKIGFWGVTPLSEAFELFNRINLGSHENFLDLGYGDGRLVLLAAIFGVQAHGIEFDNELSKTALFIRRSLNLPEFKNTKLLNDNFMDIDFSEYKLLYSSPDKPFHRKGFEQKLMREMSGDIIVHGWEFHPQQLKKKEEHIINGEKFCIYSR